MEREKVPVKELYTEEELLTIRIPKSVRREAVGNSLMSAMFARLGKSFKWAKEHDKEYLPIVYLFAFTNDEYKEFKEFAIRVIKKQFSISKRDAEHNACMFLFLQGFASYKDGMNDERFKSNVRDSIKKYEDKCGELFYPDGWEKDLKEMCNYKE